MDIINKNITDNLLAFRPVSGSNNGVVYTVTDDGIVIDGLAKEESTFIISIAWQPRQERKFLCKRKIRCVC